MAAFRPKLHIANAASSSNLLHPTTTLDNNGEGTPGLAYCKGYRTRTFRFLLTGLSTSSSMAAGSAAAAFRLELIPPGGLKG